MSLPKGPASLLIAAHFKRRPTTHWSPKECNVLKRLATTEHRFDDNCEELKLVLRYQKFERRKGRNGIHRRDLYTFLNNYGGERDRAVEWDSARNARQRPPRQAGSRTDATGANIMTDVDPVEAYVPGPISEELQRFADQFEQKTGRKLKGFDK